jgi:hypothetical protein
LLEVLEHSLGCEMFRTNPDRPWDPPSLVYNGHRPLLPAGNWGEPVQEKMASGVWNSVRVRSGRVLCD